CAVAWADSLSDHPEANCGSRPLAAESMERDGQVCVRAEPTMSPIQSCSPQTDPRCRPGELRYTCSDLHNLCEEIFLCLAIDDNQRVANLQRRRRRPGHRCAAFGVEQCDKSGRLQRHPTTVRELQASRHPKTASAP